MRAGFPLYTSFAFRILNALKWHRKATSISEGQLGPHGVLSAQQSAPHTGRKPRIYYLGMINTDGYAKHRGRDVYSGAASHKMLLVCKAMRAVNLAACIISAPPVGAAGRKSLYPRALTREGAPVAFFPTPRTSLLRKITAPLHFAAFSLVKVQKRDKIILYNQAFEYIFCLIILRLRRIEVFHDIEDAPNAEDQGWRGWLNHNCFRIVEKLTADRKMVVSDHVAQRLGLSKFVVISGVADSSGIPEICWTEHWDKLLRGGPLRLHFGGTLITATGIDLFCRAIAKLANTSDVTARSIELFVTGVGDIKKIMRLQSDIGPSPRISLSILPSLSRPDYDGLLGTCHASLSLRLPKSAMAETTFPSKVIEITARGLALVTTRLDCLTACFREDEALYLADANPEILAQTIELMCRDPGRVRRVAHAGQEACQIAFSQQVVGRKMKHLLGVL